MERTGQANLSSSSVKQIPYSYWWYFGSTCFIFARLIWNSCLTLTHCLPIPYSPEADLLWIWTTESTCLQGIFYRCRVSSNNDVYWTMNCTCNDDQWQTVTGKSIHLLVKSREMTKTTKRHFVLVKKFPKENKCYVLTKFLYRRTIIWWFVKNT